MYRYLDIKDSDISRYLDRVRSPAALLPDINQIIVAAAAGGGCNVTPPRHVTSCTPPGASRPQ